MSKPYPHVPRAPHPRLGRAAPRCSAGAPFVFAVVLCQDGASTVWTYSTLAPAERRFADLKRQLARRVDAARLTMKYVHMDCDRPQDHRFDGVTPL